MKKLIAMALGLSLALSACYDDYIKDFDYTSVYFMYQTNARTFVVGEGMKIEVGAALAGVRENKQDRVVNFVLDNALVNAGALQAMKSGATYIREAIAGVDTLKPMPADYFTISDNSKMVIKSGGHMGSVVIRPDSAKFLKDAATIRAGYAIPFYIASADADSVIGTKRSAVVALKYENMLFGNYWHGGVTTVKDASGKVVRTVKYYTTIPSPEAKIFKLKTVAPDALVTNKISDQEGSFKITLDGNTVKISKADGSKVEVKPEGASTFNRPRLLQDRKLYLSYKYENEDGTTSYAQDTLTFRNRIRDGVNEWQDENPDHYK
ncbi:hypothetical protein GCM10010967_16270 [Dyadobacter beijingensis]|uniref:BT-3987-like N-terminal domain-containing protein n=1 Tax=Dyadobacter beijingensis TaxID=365489 RepID=A0ABQ2HM24_9BACT|nr:DUF1735 domain-containing protein [Dyadobacter beijingensis]GGM85047.1 hypothetical protein GCM10010967_16270 [Dyadobacter beijingensis]